jgi:hypothetical protein
MKNAIRTRLTDDSAVAALVGSRVYTMDTRPQGSALPAIAIRQIGGNRHYSHDGEAGQVEGRVEINCYGASGASAAALATAARRAIEGLGFTAGGETVQGVFIDGEQDFSAGAESEGVRVYRVALDAVVWYQEA